MLSARAKPSPAKGKLLRTKPEHQQRSKFKLPETTTVQDVALMSGMDPHEDDSLFDEEKMGV